ncbi:MAG: SUF system NifU family Fe-S cluster assembly protein [Myxococcota bacterium]|jgi:nitrogen fixation NifU-like protein|nr:SUF system NifU family Fe-S cluster assembly protein [Myxococcota bacterium]
MDDLRELYQTVILDHNKAPRNFGELEDPDRQADGHNPLCGDRLTLHLQLDENDRVVDVKFSGQGCAISTASTSLMTEYALGKTKDEILATKALFHELVTGNPNEEGSTDGLGKLAVFGGVREFPARVKCATLAWHTMEAALNNDEQPATTE